MHRVAHKKIKQVPSYSKEHYFGQSKNHLFMPSMRRQHPPLAGAMSRMPSLEHARGKSFGIDLE